MRIVIGTILNPWIKNFVYHLQNQFTQLGSMAERWNCIKTQLDKTITIRPLEWSGYSGWRLHIKICLVRVRTRLSESVSMCWGILGLISGNISGIHSSNNHLQKHPKVGCCVIMLLRYTKCASNMKYWKWWRHWHSFQTLETSLLAPLDDWHWVGRPYLANEHRILIYFLCGSVYMGKHTH